jgi:hypothetical protein
MDEVKERKRILCLDFDGVIHSYKSGWKGESIIDDPPVPGAVRFIYNALYSFRVVIFSSRSSTDSGVNAMKKWLERWCREDLSTMHVRPIRGEWWLEIEWPKNKPSAFLTIDDRAITFDGTFPEVHELLAFKTWMEKDAR